MRGYLLIFLETADQNLNIFGSYGHCVTSCADPESFVKGSNFDNVFLIVLIVYEGKEGPIAKSWPSLTVDGPTLNAALTQH